ncbi:MAG: hypothetical protein NTZ98_25410 [Acidobacteria bacterium]|jgi:hypothetical protein|nr:hypothetical protein [Acidobacteriota bacterium]
MDEETPKLIPTQEETARIPAAERTPRAEEAGEARPSFTRSYPVLGYE